MPYDLSREAMRSEVRELHLENPELERGEKTRESIWEQLVSLRR